MYCARETWLPIMMVIFHKPKLNWNDAVMASEESRAEILETGRQHLVTSYTGTNRRPRGRAEVER